MRRSILRSRPARLGVTAVVAALAAASTGAVWPDFPYPSNRSVEQAAELARDRGPVSFAVVSHRGRVRGWEPDLAYSSASVSKALLLAAELRRLRRAGEPLDPETRSLLEAMITVSDNSAADVIYARVGDAGMQEVASRAGMESFGVIPGYWGGAQVTAADLARFFFDLRRNLAGPHRGFGLETLAGVVAEQRWGIPAALGSSWRVWFKGGWRPSGTEQTSGPVAHQAALLRHRSGRRVALAVLSDLEPWGGGFEAIEEIASILLAEPPPRPSRWQPG